MAIDDKPHIQVACADCADEEDEEADEEAEEESEEAAQEGFLGEASVPLSAAQEERDLSAHERRMQRMAERARKLEEQNVGDKEWFMRGEADSGLLDRAICRAFASVDKLLYVRSVPPVQRNVSLHSKSHPNSSSQECPIRSPCHTVKGRDIVAGRAS